MKWGNAITYLAETRVQGRGTRFGIKDADRTHHLALLGRPGSERVPFLTNMILQDIERGVGVLVLDAGGDLTQALLERMPHAAEERLIVLDPSDGEHPYSWNPIDDFRALPEEAAVPMLADMLASVYQCDDGPLTSRAAGYLLAHPEATFLFLYNIVADQKARERLLSKSGPEREAFESAFVQSPDAVVSIKEYGQYLGKDTLMRNLLGQGVSKFTLSTLGKQGAVVIVDLSHIRMFPTRVTPLTRLILSAARAEADANPFAVYMHDCLRYLSERNLERILLDRNIALTVSDTSHGEESVFREKLLQRAGSVAAFVPQEEDMHLVGRAVYPYVAAEELAKLGEGELIIALAIDSVRSRPFYARALPFPPRSGISAQDLRLASRERYSIPRLAAEKLFKVKEEPEKKKEDADSFSGAFRSIFAKRATDAPPSKPADIQTPAPPASPLPPPATGAPKPPEKKKPDMDGVVRDKAPAEPPEIPEGQLKKMLHVGKPPE